MTAVTVEEAREKFPELLQRAAAGEQIVITEGGKWLAMLGKAPALLRPVPDEAERQRLLEEFERDIARWHEEDGLPYPPQEAQPERPQPESPAA
jgi:antitoxin (DNA-binding transcriptional repressor) of toxin-antitoxin stability system